MTLSELIRSFMIDKRLSYRKLQARALARGHVLAHTHFQKLVEQRIVRLPEDKTLRAVAAALHVHLDTVRYAALRSLGWKINTPCPVAGGAVVISVEELTDNEVAQVRDAAAQAIRTIMESREREHSTTAG